MFNAAKIAHDPAKGWQSFYCLILVVRMLFFAALKPTNMAEEIDYRTMNEVQLKYELKKLEKRILSITGDPLATGKDHRKFFRWASNKNSVENVGLMMNDRSYILELLFEKHCTPSEVTRLEKVNELLLDLTNRTYKRTASLARKVLSMPREELDDDLTVEGKLVPEYDLTSSVLRLEDDAYYGSDFARMAAILQETEEYQPGMADVRCYLDQIENFTPAITDKELGCVNELDDGTSWAEAWLSIPPLEHITICYALHALVTHMNWSIPDVLRINDYKIEVTLTVQQFSDQDRNHLWWWRKYDLPRFKDVLLKEAESREKKLPLETFILQRSQDYFEEWADEAFEEVGLTDLDLYFQRLYNKINRIEQ